jgi:acetyltransferase-like isoleucine patch superfamily enzyme
MILKSTCKLAWSGLAVGIKSTGTCRGVIMVTEEIESQAGPGLHKSLFAKKSSSGKYREMVVGKQGLLVWLWYELVILLFSIFPGVLGLAMRKVFYPTIFKKVGKGVVFGRNMVIRHPHKIVIGDNVIIDDDTLIDAKGDENEGIVIGDYVTIGRFSSLVCKNADIQIGSHVNIGTNVKIVVANKGKIEIGSRIDIGSSCHFSGGSYDFSQTDVLPSTQRQPTKGIVVEDLAWVGAGVIVLDGVRIGSKSIVGAGAVVTADVPPNSIAFGVPAVVKKSRE